MDQKSDLYPLQTEAASLNNQITKATESVANKLAIVGDDLSQSYNLPHGSGLSTGNAAPCSVMEGCFDWFVLLMKASNLKYQGNNEMADEVNFEFSRREV